MRKILILVLCLFVTGCAASTRLTRLKDKGENVATVEVQGDISKSKDVVRKVAKELKLIERPSAETENFMFINNNQLKRSAIQLVSGGLGSMAYATNLGFFFNYNKDKDVTTITISEEVSSFGDPRRFTFVDKIKLKQLELNKNRE